MLRAAVVGAGAPIAQTNANLEGFSIGYSHARAYLNHPDVELVAIADINEVNARALMDFAGAKASYASLDQLLAEQQIDIISICTWPTLHCEMVLAAVAAGVRMILCEKPMAVSLAEIDVMVASADRAGARLFVNHQRRFEMPYTGVRTLIDDGVLGTVIRLEGFVGNGWDLMSWGSHWVDMARFFAGDRAVDWAFAASMSSGNVRYGHVVEDQMLLQFGFDNGALGLVHTGAHTEDIGFIVTGTNGSIRLSGSDVVVALHDGDSHRTQADYFTPAAEGVDGFTLAVADMIAATERGTASRIDGVSGHATTELVMAAFASSETRTVQRLPLADRTVDLRAR